MFNGLLVDNWVRELDLIVADSLFDFIEVFLEIPDDWCKVYRINRIFYKLLL